MGFHTTLLKFLKMENNLKFGILGAMNEEVACIKEMMVIDKETTIAGRLYSEGRINNTEVVLVFSRWGKVAAASTTTILINKFEVDSILFMGVAGAVSDLLNIGDIVVANGLYQHDMDARPFFDLFQIPLTPTIIFSPNDLDIEKGKHAAQLFVNEIKSVFDDHLLKKYLIAKPSVHTGLIASGDQFISDPKSHKNLNYHNNKTLAVEMEGASVAQVCEDHKIPYVVIRIISDKADHSAAINFQSFINDVTSKYSSGIVKEYIKLFE